MSAMHLQIDLISPRLDERLFAFPLRVLLSIMYLMVETIRVQTEDDRPEWRAARDAFKSELGVCAVCVRSQVSGNAMIQTNIPENSQAHLFTTRSPSLCSSSPW